MSLVAPKDVKVGEPLAEEGISSPEKSGIYYLNCADNINNRRKRPSQILD